jgi:FKBP-type peptidyl-prolyl cis-trans isomerase FklB
LQYEVIKTGTGEKPVDGQNIKVIYNGTFIDGTRFDGSDKPVQFNINQLITGWTEALKMMTPGTKWKLYIPYQLAYGSQGRDGIPGGAALLFDLELVEIVK